MSERIRVGILTVLTVMLLAGSMNLTAMPPHPDLMANIDQSGADLPYALQQRNQLLERGVDSPFLPGGRIATAKRLTAGTSGYKLLCIMVEFVDKAATVSEADFDTLIFGTDPPSVKDYYNEVSYGNFDIVTVNLPSTTGWNMAPSTYAYYCNGVSGLGVYPQNCQKLVEDLVTLLNPAIDFADYDNDGDGWVDGLTIVHSGKGAEAETNPALVNNLIWSHKWNTNTPINVDGKKVFIYSIQPEFIFYPGDATIGVYCHELGHSIFGLPDLYDTDYSSNGLGFWSIMSVGSWNGPSYMGSSPAHPDAWCREQCGFATAHVVAGNVNQQAIPAIETNATGLYRLWSNGVVGDEYYLIENRQQAGYDTYLPSNGLLIYHIDEDVETANDSEWYPGYSWNGHYLVALEQADNLYELEKFLDYGDTGDPFPGTYGRISFTTATTPSSNAYAGYSTLVAVDNIGPSDAVMYADLRVALAAAVDDYTYIATLPESFDLGQNYPNPFNPTTRIRFALPTASDAQLTVHNLLGQLIETLIDDRLPAGEHQLDWTAENGQGVPLPSGVYFYRLQVDGFSQTRKMILLR